MGREYAEQTFDFSLGVLTSTHGPLPQYEVQVLFPQGEPLARHPVPRRIWLYRHVTFSNRIKGEYDEVWRAFGLRDPSDAAGFQALVGGRVDSLREEAGPHTGFSPLIHGLSSIALGGATLGEDTSTYEEDAMEEWW